MRHIVSSITGLMIASSILFPSVASAAAVNVVKFDTLSGNGSLFERIANGTIEPRVRAVHTTIVTGTPVLDDVGYAKNMNELWQFGKQISCAAKLDASVCRTRAE